MKILPSKNLTLNDEKKFAKIIAGKVEVYAVTVDKKNFFRQFFLMELDAGNAAFPALDEFNKIEIILKATEQSEVEILNFDEITPQKIFLMRDWFANLSKLPTFKRLADIGDENLKSWQEKNLFSEKNSPTETYNEFVENEKIFSMLIGSKFESDNKKFLKQVETRKNFNQTLYAESVARLLGEEPRAYAKNISGSPKFEEIAFIVNRVTRALKLPEKNLELETDIVKKLDNANLIKKLAQKSNFYLRRIQIEKNWHKQDNGVIIGYFGEKEEVAAFLPISTEKYLLVTKNNPDGIVITDEIAKKIAPFAYACYAGFPQKKLTMKDIWKFILNRLWSEDHNSILIASFIIGAAAIITPMITKTIFEDIIPIFDRQGLATVTQVAIMTCVITAIISVARSVAVLRITTNVGIALEAALIGRVFSFPAKFFRKFQVGNLAQRLSGISEIKNILTTQTVAAIFNLIFAFWNIILMFYYSVKYTTIALVIWIFYAIIMIFLYRNLIIYNRGKIDARNKTSGILQQIFSGLSKFRVQGAESSAFYLWSKNFSEQWNFNLKSRWQTNYQTIISSIQPLVASIILYYLVADNMQDAIDKNLNPYNEVIDYATFIAFQTAFTGFNTTLNGFFPVISQLFLIQPHIENLRPILEEIPEVSEEKTEVGVLAGFIEINNLNFSYGDDLPDVLKNINLKISAGENVAIVGKSGCGKSTLIRLLLGFENPKSGAIFFDGQDLADLNLTSVRSQMGVVLQNGQLMTGDIFSNIVGTMNLSLDDAWKAAEAAGIAEDIKNMPMGMNTLLSEGSTNISGGQRQRILIARALAAKPAIIIFDEATSALDNRTQAIVTESLKKLHATRIIVAHRLSTIRDCDKIFVIDDGKIIESGNFDELIKKGGLFAELVKNQTSA